MNGKQTRNAAGTCLFLGREFHDVRADIVHEVLRVGCDLRWRVTAAP